MTNREQVAWAFAFSEYDAREIAKIVADMLDAAGAAFMSRYNCEQLAVWLKLYEDTGKDPMGNPLEGAGPC